MRYPPSTMTVILAAGLLTPSLMFGGEDAEEMRIYFEQGDYSTVVKLALKPAQVAQLGDPSQQCLVGIAAREEGDIQLAAALLVGKELTTPGPLGERCRQVASELETRFGEVTWVGPMDREVWIQPMPREAFTSLEAKFSYQRTLQEELNRPWLLPYTLWLPVGTWTMGDLKFEVIGGQPVEVNLADLQVPLDMRPPSEMEAASQRASLQAFTSEAPRPVAPRGWGVQAALVGGVVSDPLYTYEGAPPVPNVALRLSISREILHTHLRGEVQMGVGQTTTLTRAGEGSAEAEEVEGWYDLALLMSRQIYVGPLGLSPGIGMTTQPIQAWVNASSGCNSENPQQICVTSESGGAATEWWWPGVGGRIEVEVGAESWRHRGLAGLYLSPGIDLVVPLFTSLQLYEPERRVLARPYLGVGGGWGW